MASGLTSRKEDSKAAPIFKEIAEGLAQKTVVGWLESSPADMSGKVGRFPTREEIDIPLEEHLIVELYSR